MNNTRYQTTLKIVKAIRNLQCPVCGHRPIVELTSADSYKLTMPCHQELADLIEQTKLSFIESKFIRTDPIQD